MGGIKDRVAIIGMGCTKFGENWQKSAEDMMVDAAAEACQDAGIELKDIQAAWLATMWSGRSGTMVSRALKLKYIPITRVENLCCSGTDAFRNACYAVAAGVYDIALAIGVEKLKDSGWSGIPGPPTDYDVLPITAPVGPAPDFAQLALGYMQRYKLSYDEMKSILSKTAVKNHHNGSLNPKAHFQREITYEQAWNAPMIAWPLGLYDCCGVSDGCAAAIITRTDMAKNFRDDYVLVKGLSVACGYEASQALQDWDYSYVPENIAAAKGAYAEAGVTDPREEIDMAEVHDCFTCTELAIMEDLGFSPRGKVKKDVDSGFFTLDGGLPVNTDGGLKCFGHPIGASGLRMIYEVYKQLQGKAGPRQLKQIDLGLTHNLGGHPSIATVSVAIFGRRD
jgi:acetyl-CoA C-acetyltransferase